MSDIRRLFLLVLVEAEWWCSAWSEEWRRETIYGDGDGPPGLSEVRRTCTGCGRTDDYGYCCGVAQRVTRRIGYARVNTRIVELADCDRSTVSVNGGRLSIDEIAAESKRGGHLRRWGWGPPTRPRQCVARYAWFAHVFRSEAISHVFWGVHG